MLWSDVPAVQGKKYLRQCLWQLQHALASSGAQPVLLLHLDRDLIDINPVARLWVDVQQFDDAFALVRDVPGGAFDEQQVEAARAAAALYRDELLSGWYQD